MKRVVILGANGAMGAGAAEVFAAGGCEVLLLARTTERAREGLLAVQNMAKSERVADRMSIGTYDADLDSAGAEADLIFEALAEDLALKTAFLERVDRCRGPDSIVATATSGLSVAALARGASESLQQHFLGIHLFNPPHMIVGTEVIPHPAMDPALVSATAAVLERRFGRVVVVCNDTPAFAGNRVGFKVLNQAAQLAATYGVAFMDYLVGRHTGRVMPPLATIDLVGWDVHKAIVDNVHAHTDDEARGAFALPAYMTPLLGRGHLGNKTPQAGGFYRRTRENHHWLRLVLDPASGAYRDPREVKVPPLRFVEKMRELHRLGRYAEAFAHFLRAPGEEADLARAVVLGYISYALSRVGDGGVVRQARDMDRIMACGFNWAPPTALVDLIGLKETIAAMERSGVPLPPLLAQASPGERLFRERHMNIGRFFCA